MNIEYKVNENVLKNIVVHNVEESDISDKTIIIKIPSAFEGEKIKNIGIESDSAFFISFSPEVLLLLEKDVFNKVIFDIDEGITKICCFQFEFKEDSYKVKISLKIPSSVKIISKEAFKDLVFSDFSFAEDCKVKSIKKDTFNHCYFKEKFVLPKNCNRLDEFAFCKAFFYQGFDFGNSLVDIIPSFAFYEADFNETDLILSKKVCSIELSAFMETKRLNNFIVPEDGCLVSMKDAAFLKSGVKNVYFYNSNKIDFGTGCFSKCTRLKIVDLSKTSTEIISANFCSEVHSLEQVLVPPTVSTLSAFCFYFSGLKSFTAINLSKIGMGCFEGCYKFESCDFSNSKESILIGYHAFNGTKKLKTISLPKFAGDFDLSSFEGVPLEVLKDIQNKCPFFNLM